MNEPAAHIAERSVAPAEACSRLARDLLDSQSRRLPDLSGALVLLPNLHAASAVAGELGRAAGRPLWLPRFTTLGEWASAEPAGAGTLPESVREAMLFDALRSRGWLRAPDRWPLAGELSSLFDDLTRYAVRLPASMEEFVAQLEAAYQARAGTPMQLEARLVHELWHAVSRPEADRADPVALYHLRLAQIAEAAASPLFAVVAAEPTPAEQAFFETYSRRAPVMLYRIDASAGDAAERTLDAAWPVSPEGASLRARAQSLASQVARSPLAERVAIYGAPGLEHEAAAIDAQVRGWLVDGKQSIAVVALDRLVARRVRALLERAQVMVADETGWLFSTTSASTVVMRWLDALSGDFYHHDLLDLLKSPFVAADWAARREAVFEIERAAREHSIVSGLSEYIDAVRRYDDSKSAVELLERVRKAARVFHRDRRRSLHDWLELLFGSLAALGVIAGLRRDAAGLQLIEFLERLGRELKEIEATFTFAEWRQWLDRQLESAEFRDTGVASPVIFTQLSLTRLRSFDAAALVGADAAHLPGELDQGMFFNQGVRRQLGLPDAGQQLRQFRDDLVGLISRSQSVLITWQAIRAGENNLPSPFIERLQVFHELAWRAPLPEGEAPALAAAGALPPPVAAELPAQTARPVPAAVEALLPQKVSASGYNSLLACPYQFHARYLLGLRKPEEVQEALEKRDYGEHVHRILRRFHQQFPVASQHPRAELERSLAEISDAVFAEATEADYLSHGWLLRWKATIPAYLDWQSEREASGWRFHAAETELGLEIELPGGARFSLEGRIDRIDRLEERGGQRFAVLDYKARNRDALRRELKEAGEDVQLPVYAALMREEVAEAFYLSLDKDSTEAVRLSAKVLAEAGRAVDRLRDIFARLRQGAPMPAQGIDAACQWCEMRGLCRKDYWS